VLLQSGTATANRWKKLSTRVNSINLITVDPDQIAIQVREYDTVQHAYASAANYAFPRNVR
jgi:hypothetical protein